MTTTHYHDDARNTARQFGALWTAAHPVVTAYIRSSVLDFHRAEDLLQDTAAIAAEKFGEYDSARPFLPWALGIARNELLRHFRDQSRDRHIFDENVIQQITVMYGDLGPRLNERQESLEACIKQLHGRSRKLLEMRYVREKNPRMIAETTGMSINAVSVMLHRVRKALHECVERRMASVAARQSSGGG